MGTTVNIYKGVLLLIWGKGFTEFPWFFRFNIVTYKYVISLIYIIFFNKLSFIEGKKAAKISVK